LPRPPRVRDAELNTQRAAVEDVAFKSSCSEVECGLLQL
jgi:hypothetical protein